MQQQLQLQQVAISRLHLYACNSRQLQLQTLVETIALPIRTINAWRKHLPLVVACTQFPYENPRPLSWATRQRLEALFTALWNAFKGATSSLYSLFPLRVSCRCPAADKIETFVWYCCGALLAIISGPRSSI